jgi:hypothetical protein
MESTYPKAPERRGRSRFSKALPLPPPPPAPPPITKDTFRALTSIPISLHSALPPIPKDSSPLPKSKMSKMSIPRRPVGAPATEHSKTESIASASSNYSSSPGFSRSLSNSSNKTKDSLSWIDADTPPLPPKDSQRQQIPKSTLESPASGFQSLPPRPELWQRRSVKSDRSIVVHELKLNKSNGSTANSPPRQPLPERELPTVPSQLPRSFQVQNPIPARPAPPQPDLGVMGNKLSKLKEKTKSGSSDSSQDVQPSTYPSFHSKRLPTPEYLKSDRQQPMIPQVLSPTSPETPPHDDPPALPQKSESRSTSTLKVVPDTVLANTTNRPNLLSSHSRDTSETLTITSEPQVLRSPQPQKAYAAKILTPTPSPPLSTSAPKTPPAASPLALSSPAVNLNITFPKPSTPATPGTIFQGPELDIVHFECYQNHALMRNSKNTVCPVACMLCRKKELGQRWRCSWCCLSACGPCMQVLTSTPGRDLRVCVEKVGKRGEQSNGIGHGQEGGSWSGR